MIHPDGSITYTYEPCRWTFAEPVDESPHTIDSLLKENEELRATLARAERWLDDTRNLLSDAEDKIAELRAELVAEPESAPTAAIKTLQFAGYTYTDGAELWRPPLGKPPSWVLSAKYGAPESPLATPEKSAEELSEVEINLFHMLNQVRSKPRPEGVKPPLGALLIGPTEEKYRGLGFCDA